MRKILLATTAVVGLAVAGAAQAATSPLTVNVGGSVDVLAGKFHESKATAASDRASTDFETLYALTFGVKGKTSSGLEYGADLVLDNAPDIDGGFGGTSSSISVSAANIHMAGSFGKVVVGDSHGATDLALMAPVVGEGQVYGRYIDFLDTATFAKHFVAGVDVTDHSTNITYFTPKVGNDNHKVQAAVSYVPQFYNYGGTVTQYKNGNTLSPYSDVVKGAVAYTGNFSPVTVGLSAHMITGSAEAAAGGETWIANAGAGKVRDFTSWGLGAQAAYNGFTLGGGYTDLNHYNTVGTQNKDQYTFNAGLKYEFSKYAVGVSYLGGKGYANTLGTAYTNKYIKDFDSYGVGGSYTWAPGLSTNVDGVMFEQKNDAGVSNDGYVLLVSQKLAF